MEKITFLEIVGKKLKIALVFRDFAYRKLVFVQHEYDIRNQHKKLHRRTYILSENIFHQNSTVLPTALL